MFQSVRSRTAIVATLLLGGVMAGLAGCAIRPRDATGPTASAIEAALTIDFPSDRLRVLGRIAAQEQLSQSEQVYLVDAVCVGGFGDDQADVLVTLIESPCCTQQTCDHIVDRLPWCGLGGAKERVVDALIDHPPSE